MKWEMNRKARLAEFEKSGLGFTAAELQSAIDTEYDVLAMRLAEKPEVYRAVKSPVKRTRNR